MMEDVNWFYFFACLFHISFKFSPGQPVCGALINSYVPVSRRWILRKKVNNSLSAIIFRWNNQTVSKRFTSQSLFLKHWDLTLSKTVLNRGDKYSHPQIVFLTSLLSYWALVYKPVSLMLQLVKHLIIA